MVEQLIAGFLMVIQPNYLLAMLLGVAFGVLVGAVPGLTSAIGISLMIPITYGMDPLFALCLMAGIHNGGHFGGAIPAILLNIPGTPGAVCTGFDGYPMAQKGFAREALNLAAFSSAAGGVLSGVLLLMVAPPLARVTLVFGPPEIFWINILGLCSVAMLLGKDPLKGLLAAAFGLLIGSVGTDLVSGHQRFTFGVLELLEGIPLVVVLVGLFALPSAWRTIEETDVNIKHDVFALLKKGAIFVWPIRRLFSVIVKSTGIGILVGLLPGIGGVAASFIAYNEARRSAPDTESFGEGAPEGVASSEASNSADNAAAMVPALTLGIPGSGSAAIMLGVLVVHGMQPGPDLFSDPHGVVWGYMWAMLLTSAILLVCGGQISTRIFGQILRVPPLLLMPLIIVMAVIGTYSIENSMFNVYSMFVFSLIGYAMKQLDFPMAPVILGLVLGDKAEGALRTSMLLNQGDPSILVTRPISLFLLLLVVLVLLYPPFKMLLKRRNVPSNQGLE